MHACLNDDVEHAEPTCAGISAETWLDAEMSDSRATLVHSLLTDANGL